MKELLFYRNEDIFYDDNGVLREEPEESLEELIERYIHNCTCFCEFKDRQLEAAEGYVNSRWIGDIEPEFIEDEKRGYAHRTRKNTEWADITLAIAADMESQGEKTTMKAAGDRYVGYQLPENFADVCHFSNPMCDMAEEIVGKLKAHPNFKQEGLKLNIAGNGLPALSRHGITTWMIKNLLWYVFIRLKNEKVHIGEIRSGGQTGVDEAGIIAAQQFRIKCSVLAPKGFRMHYEDGVEIEGREKFVERFREKYIEMDRWCKEREDDSFDWGIADFNGSNFIEMEEYDIDLKIMHLNAREKAQLTSQKQNRDND